VRSRRCGACSGPAGGADRGFIIAGTQGWSGTLTLILLAAGIAGAAAFALVEHAVRNPMVDPVVFRELTFSICVALGVIFNFCVCGAIFCLAIDLHRTLGLDPLPPGRPWCR
jgi:MFS transporter, DHA2 family, methylenomycin A resistance protein